jgi:hypothetical protein
MAKRKTPRIAGVVADWRYWQARCDDVEHTRGRLAFNVSAIAAFVESDDVAERYPTMSEYRNAVLMLLWRALSPEAREAGCAAAVPTCADGET